MTLTPERRAEIEAIVDHTRNARPPYPPTSLSATIVELFDALKAAEGHLAKVRWLAEPYVDLDGEPDGYQHYAINLTDGVHFAVLLDDLRSALGVNP